MAYRKQNVNKIHSAQNGISNSHEMELIAPGNEDGCDYMVRKHLIVVLPTIFDMEYKDLLEPKC